MGDGGTPQGGLHTRCHTRKYVLFCRIADNYGGRRPRKFSDDRTHVGSRDPEWIITSVPASGCVLLLYKVDESMAGGIVEVAARELTRDVDMPVKKKPSLSEILFISLPPRIGSLFGSENNDGHRYLLPTDSCVEEFVIPSVANFRSSCTKTKYEKVNSWCLPDSPDNELQIMLGHESIIICFIESTHVPEVDVCVSIERDGDTGKWCFSIA